MRFGIAIPQFAQDGSFDPDRMHEYLARAEALGFESAWTQEQTLGAVANLGALETMAYAAACTKQLRLGCAVFVSSLHSPVHLAKSLSTLDQLTRGRLEIGLGSGGPGRMFTAFGIDRSTYLDRFTECLDVMQALWAEPRVSFAGRFWRLDEAAMEPKPVQKPYPPIWLGGSHPAALRRAAQRADGFFGAGSQTTEEFGAQVGIVRALLAEQPRARDFRIAKRVYLAVGDSVEVARERVREVLSPLYRTFGMPDVTAVAVFGPPDRVAQGLQEVREAGAELLLLNPLFSEPDQMEWLAAEVLPQLGD